MQRWKNKLIREFKNYRLIFPSLRKLNQIMKKSKLRCRRMTNMETNKMREKAC